MHQLEQQGASVVALDDLSTGVAARIPRTPLVRGSISDAALVKEVLSDFRIDTVAHIAAKTDVTDSVHSPLHFYTNNTAGTLSLLECCQQARVSRFVFSSTAAVYGLASGEKAVNERSGAHPINPYGASKLMAERILRDTAISSGSRHVILRCFNIAGASLPEGLYIPNEGAKHLIHAACEVATGRRKALTIFGMDLPTPDGTGVRDYVHVEDVVNAVIDAIKHLQEGGKSLTLNCGSGRGRSVRDVLLAVERVAGVTIPIVEASPRSVDPPSLISDSSRIRNSLRWTPRHNDLDMIVRSTLSAVRGANQNT